MYVQPVQPIVTLLCIQVARILPDSVLRRRHLLREGDYIVSVNGQSLEDLSSTECDEQLATSSLSVVSIQLLRQVDHSAVRGTDQQPSIDTRELQEAVEVEDYQPDSRHECSTLQRRSLSDELNQNELFARSKLRLVSDHSDSDHNATRLGQLQAQELSYQTLSARLVKDSDRFESSDRGLVRRRCAKNKLPKHETCGHTNMLEQPTHSPVIKSSKVPAGIRKRSPPTLKHTVDTQKRSKGVRFKLLTIDTHVKPTKNNVERRQEKLFSTDPLFSSRQQKKVGGKAICSTKTTGDHQVTSTCGIVKEAGDVSTSNNAVIRTTTSTGFPPHRTTSSVQQRGSDRALSASSNSRPVKIYTSVINVCSNGSVMLTTRVTTSDDKPFHSRQSSSRPEITVCRLQSAGMSHYM